MGLTLSPSVRSAHLHTLVDASHKIQRRFYQNRPEDPFSDSRYLAPFAHRLREVRLVHNLALTSFIHTKNLIWGSESERKRVLAELLI